MITRRESRETGFTVIELLVVAVVFALAGVLVFLQMNSLKVANEDKQRKTAINAMHYALEEVYYKKNKSYPSELTSATLPSVDPELFTDPDGFTLGKEALSEEELKALIESGDTSTEVEKRLSAITQGKSPNYHYDPKDCNLDGRCQGYTLRADLVNEAQYVKSNRPR